jgi:HK97 family phage prohead protease
MPATTHRGGALQFTVPIDGVKFEAAKDAGRAIMRGHAAVFNRKSHDLGGFRTVIHSTFFDNILDTDPAVHLVWDHDTRWVLGYTRNKSLELRRDPHGLHTWSMFPDTATAQECATLLEGGYIDQMSFACDIGEDEWTEDEDGNITRTLYKCSGLFDVTICAQGAFPQTDAHLVASVHDAGSLLASAQEAGRVIRREQQDPDLVASRGEIDDSIAEPPVEDEGAADVASHADRLAALKGDIVARYSAATESE